jgi:hypothetical protein
MKLSDRKVDSEFLSNGPWYSILALYMPMSALIMLIYLAENLLSLSLPLLLLTACSFASALAASLYCDFMKNNMSSQTTANLRGGIIILALSYIASSFFRPDLGLRERFLPGLFNLPICACALYMWVNVIKLKQLFSACRRIEKHTELHRGEELKKAIYEDASVLQYIDEKIVKTRRNYLVMLVFIGILTLTCSFISPLPLALYPLLLVILVNGICIFGFFGIIRYEHYYAGEGVRLSAPDRTKRILAMAVFSLLCIIAAIIPASDKSIFPLSIITGFFKWLFSLVRPLDPNTSTFNPDTFMDMEPFQSLPNFQEAGDPPSPFWERFRRIVSLVLRYGVIILAAAGFIRFMIAPLLNRGDLSGKMTFRQKLKKIITEWFKSMLNALASIAAFLKRDKSTSKLRKYNADEIRRTAESIFGAYSPAKRNDIKRSVTLFARLIIWGSEVRGITWKPSLAPGEYCDLLASAKTPQNDAPDDASAIQQRNEGIIRSGELFEQALYSAEVLSEEERKEFKTLVEEITSVSE